MTYQTSNHFNVTVMRNVIPFGFGFTWCSESVLQQLTLIRYLEQVLNLELKLFCNNVLPLQYSEKIDQSSHQNNDMCSVKSLGFLTTRILVSGRDITKYVNIFKTLLCI